MSGNTEKINRKCIVFLNILCALKHHQINCIKILFLNGPVVYADLIKYTFIIVTNCNFLETKYCAV